MDYSQLSDFEINKLVAEATSTQVEETYQFVNGGENISDHMSGIVLMRKITSNRKHWKLYDPCNNPADAWPIIAENKISTMWMTSEKEWCAWAKGDLEEGTWDWKNVPDYYFNCESQLRAAMIVFLMMQGDKHA